MSSIHVIVWDLDHTVWGLLGGPLKIVSFLAFEVLYARSVSFSKNKRQLFWNENMNLNQ